MPLIASKQNWITNQNPIQGNEQEQEQESITETVKVTPATPITVPSHSSSNEDTMAKMMANIDILFGNFNKNLEKYINEVGNSTPG